MRVLVTGGAGFIGRWTVRAFLSRGDEVLVLDNLSNGSHSNLAEFRSRKGFRFLEGDVADRRDVDKAFADGPDLCVHLAAIIEVQQSIQDPLGTFNVNVMGTANVLEACRARDSRLTFVSTCMVFARAAAGAAIAEDHPTRPASPYASSKLAGEFLVQSYHRAYGLPTAVLRPFNTYGPYQKTNQEGGVVPIFADRAMRGEPLLIFGDGRQTRDFLDVDDCVDLILRASENARAVGEEFNGGTGRAVTINALARLIGGPTAKIVHVPHPHPQSEIQNLRCDPSKAEKFLGWRPKVGLAAGIERLRRWMAA